MGCKPNKSRFSKLGEVKGLVVHWSAYPKALSVDEEMAQVRRYKTCTKTIGVGTI